MIPFKNSRKALLFNCINDADSLADGTGNKLSSTKCEFFNKDFSRCSCLQL